MIFTTVAVIIICLMFLSFSGLVVGVITLGLTYSPWYALIAAFVTTCIVGGLQR